MISTIIKVVICLFSLKIGIIIIDFYEKTTQQLLIINAINMYLFFTYFEMIFFNIYYNEKFFLQKMYKYYVNNNYLKLAELMITYVLAYIIYIIPIYCMCIYSLYSNKNVTEVLNLILFNTFAYVYIPLCTTRFVINIIIFFN